MPRIKVQDVMTSAADAVMFRDEVEAGDLALARRLRELLLDAGELRVEVVRDLQRQVPDHSRTTTQQKCGAVPSRDQF